MTEPLFIVSSLTGNTRLLAFAASEALSGVRIVRADAVPADLSPFNPVALFFWCDRGMAPDEIVKAASRLSGKNMGIFATMGGDPESSYARSWIAGTAQKLVSAGKENTLAGTFLCRGRIDPALFSRMSAAAGGTVTPEREARRKAAETHPDRLDCLAAAEACRQMFQAECRKEAA